MRRQLCPDLMPDLMKDEEVILFSQGGYANNLWTAWRLGHLYLTNKRILFLQPAGVIFETPFENIIEVRSDRRRYAFREKEVVFIAYKRGKAEKALNAWIVIADLETLRKKIFERLKIDEVTGEKIRYSWWIPGRRVEDVKRDTSVDVFDEGDSIIIIMEILGVKEEDILVGVNKGSVIVSASGTVRDYYEEVFLDKEVNPESMSKRYKNGILQVSLTKSGLLTKHSLFSSQSV